MKNTYLANCISNHIRLCIQASWSNRYAHFRIPHLVHQHSLIDSRTAWNKFYVPNAKGFPNRLLVQQFLHIWEVVAKAPFTFFPNVIMLKKSNVNCFPTSKIYKNLLHMHDSHFSSRLFRHFFVLKWHLD